MKTQSVIDDIQNQSQSLLNTHMPSLQTPLMTRRAFLAGSVATGFASAASPVLAQALHTDGEGLVAGGIKLTSEGTELLAYRAYPADKKNAPVILVVCEIFGVHQYIEDICRRLAKTGYYAIATNLFEREGDPGQYSNMADIFSHIISKVPDAQVIRDLNNSLNFAHSEGADTNRLGITGFCWGGRISWLYSASQPAVKAAVAWYGRLTGNQTLLTPRHPIDLAANLNAPVLGLYGGQDTGIPATDIEYMKAELAKAAPYNTAAKDSRFIVYPDAPHGFHADYRPSYKPDDAKDAWRHMLDWFKKYGV